MIYDKTCEALRSPRETFLSLFAVLRLLETGCAMSDRALPSVLAIGVLRDVAARRDHGLKGAQKCTKAHLSL